MAKKKTATDWNPDDLVARTQQAKGAHDEVLRLEKQITTLKASSKLAKDELHRAEKRLAGFLAEAFEALPLFQGCTVTAGGEGVAA